MRAFLYARVSTGEQSEQMQVRELEEFAKRRGWDAELFADAGWSGAKQKRPALDRMLALVRQRKCDVVLVYRYDRFARSLHHLVSSLAEFDSLGVQFVSLHEGVDTSTPNGRLIFHIFASIAEFERELIRERVRSGVANARAKGVRLGRPRRVANASKILAQRRQGGRWSELSKRHGISVSTARRLAKAAQTAENCQNPVQKEDKKGSCKQRT